MTQLCEEIVGRLAPSFVRGDRTQIKEVKTVSRALLFGLMLFGCKDLAEPSLHICQELSSRARLRDALEACKAAVQSDSKSQAGVAAAKLASEIETRLHAAEASAKEGFRLWDLEDNERAAAELFSKACADDCPAGCAGLGVRYLDGIGGFEKDYDKAKAYLEGACNAESARACSALGFMYSHGLSLAKNEVKAVSLFKTACDGGEPRGCSNLATRYQSGEGGLPKDEKRSFELFLKACDDGNAFGCWGVANIYLTGAAGVEKAASKSADYAQRACDGGNGEGCYILADALRTGNGRPKDTAHAEKLFSRACELDSMNGCNGQAAIFMQSNRFAEAMDLVSRACNHNNAMGCYVQSALLRQGLGAKRNEIGADNLLKKACDLGLATACKELKQ